MANIFTLHLSYIKEEYDDYEMYPRLDFFAIPEKGHKIQTGPDVFDVEEIVHTFSDDSAMTPMILLSLRHSATVTEDAD